MIDIIFLLGPLRPDLEISTHRQETNLKIYYPFSVRGKVIAPRLPTFQIWVCAGCTATEGFILAIEEFVVRVHKALSELPGFAKEPYPFAREARSELRSEQTELGAR